MCREAFMGGPEAVGLVAGAGVSRGLRVWDLEVPGSQESQQVLEEDPGVSVWPGARRRSRWVSGVPDRLRPV